MSQASLCLMSLRQLTGSCALSSEAWMDLAKLSILLAGTRYGGKGRQGKVEKMKGDGFKPKEEDSD